MLLPVKSLRSTKYNVAAFGKLSTIGDGLNTIDDIVSQLERQKEFIDRALEALRDVSATEVPVPRNQGKKRVSARGGKRHICPEGRSRIAEAARERWALQRGEKLAAAKKTGGLTAAGRKRLSQLMKARWASKNPPKVVGAKKRTA